MDNYIKVNFDAVFIQNSRESFSGVVCRDGEGFVVAAGILQHHNVGDAFVAEAMAYLQAVQLVREAGFLNIIVEGDSLTVIRKLRTSIKDSSITGPIVYDNKEASKLFSSISFNHVRREANKVAHELAKEGRNFHCPRFWIEEAPQAVLELAGLERPSTILH
ncbi:hypothetical protein like AT2G13980 [Hibiscus trionum]|uniref:RNase H type-1 domain-containing protein n=1 Tax=Hibiscus trionum TaxID=183268 RepID=A0A9W7LUS1_HIBTR|nr:hypothetical protein like AT2G13980 [Hibiscus trionum]